MRLQSRANYPILRRMGCRTMPFIKIESEMRERASFCKVSVVYQTIVATWGTPWAVELLLLVYRYVSCCLSVSATLQPNRLELKKCRSWDTFSPSGAPSAPGGRWSLRPLGRETHGAHSAALRPVCFFSSRGGKVVAAQKGTLSKLGNW